MQLYHEKLIKHHEEDSTELMSVQSQARRLVKFRDHVDEQASRRKSMSILKKKSMYRAPKNSRPKSSFVEQKNTLFGGGQGCQNQVANEKTKNNYLEKLSKIKNDQNFQDTSFPHTITSIFQLKTYKRLEGPNEKIVWKRIPEVFGKDLVLWTTNPTGLIIQGSGYCSQYMPIALNCLRSNKVLLRYIFERQVSLPQGIYYNKWQYLVIDDYIPVREKKIGEEVSYIPLFSYIQINKLKLEPVQIWFYLLQKAFSKVYSNYENLQRGNITDFFTDITGYHGSKYLINSPKLKWNQVFMRPEVLVIGVDKDKKNVPLFKQAKNPRMYFYENHHSIQKITIWPEELQKYFVEAYVWGDNNYSYWGAVQVKQTATSNICARSFKVKEHMKVCLNLTQKDDRLYSKFSTYSYSWIRFILLEKQFNGGFRWINAQYGKSRTITIETDIQPGQYLALIIPEWHQGAYPLGMVIKGSSPIKVIKENYQQGTLQEACADVAQRFGKLNQLSNFICSYNCYHQEMGMIIENINNEKIKGDAKIRRVITGVSQQGQIYPFNKQFKGDILEIDIKADKCYTVVLLTREGIKEDFLKDFKENGGESWSETPSSEEQNIE